MRLGQSFTAAFLKLLDSGLLRYVKIYPDIYIDGPDGLIEPGA